MKIPNFMNTFNLFNHISPRKEGDGGNQQNAGYQRPGDQKKKQSSAPTGSFQEVLETITVDDGQVVSAVEAFKKEAPQLASGIKADMVGSGPGLRVVLKDVNGSIVRQLSGEEFLRLRDEASKDSRTRGKILDRKM
jgi:hypothetical protein